MKKLDTYFSTDSSCCLLRQLVLLLLEVQLGPGPGHGLSLLGNQPTQVVSLLLKTGPAFVI